MAYNDLNPIRAKMASSPETSDHTSVQLRIEARQEYCKATALLESPAATALPSAQVQDARNRAERGPEAALWIAPIRATQLHPQVPTISLNDYLELVDATGRLIIGGKRGAIPSQLAPILQWLQIDVDRWVEVMLHGGAFLGTAVGKLLSLTAEAARRGITWIADKTRIHWERRLPVPTG